MVRFPLFPAALALAAVLGVAATAAAAPPNRVAIEVSPMTMDWYFGGEYVADESVSSTSVAGAYERRLARHLAAGGVLTYVQPGSMILPVVPGLHFKTGQHSTGALFRSGRMVLAQGRLRLVFPFADDNAEIGVAVQGGAAFLFFPIGYEGWGKAADVSIDATWFWSSWGVAARASAGVAFTEGSRDIGSGPEDGVLIDRFSPLAVGAALVHRF